MAKKAMQKGRDDKAQDQAMIKRMVKKEALTGKAKGGKVGKGKC